MHRASISTPETLTAIGEYATTVIEPHGRKPDRIRLGTRDKCIQVTVPVQVSQGNINGNLCRQALSTIGKVAGTIVHPDYRELHTRNNSIQITVAINIPQSTVDAVKQSQRLTAIGKRPITVIEQHAVPLSSVRLEDIEIAIAIQVA